MPSIEPRNGDRLVLYDGVCGLCNGTVRFLLRHDRAEVLTFAPLQGETARAILARHSLAGDLSTMVLVERPGAENERVRTRSDGALALFEALGGAWRLTAAFRIVPRFLRDAVYRWVARHRYGWFGRFDVCALPAEGFRRRFLDEESLGAADSAAPGEKGR